MVLTMVRVMAPFTPFLRETMFDEGVAREVVNRVQKVLVELAALQDEEVGDGTTSVVIVAAKLLKNADELVKQKIHPTSIIAGYRLAMKESVKYLKEHLAYKVQ